MHPSCSHGDHPDISLLRFVLIGEILCADATRLVLLADLVQESGLLQLSAEPLAPPPVRRLKDTLHTLRCSDAGDP
jgi:hypothetical protein